MKSDIEKEAAKMAERVAKSFSDGVIWNTLTTSQKDKLMYPILNDPFIVELLRDRARLDMQESRPLWSLRYKEGLWHVFYNGRSIGEGNTVRLALDDAIAQSGKEQP